MSLGLVGLGVLGLGMSSGYGCVWLVCKLAMGEQPWKLCAGAPAVLAAANIQYLYEADCPY